MRCANCGDFYSDRSTQNHFWCSKDHLFFCQRCVDSGLHCPICGRKTSFLGATLFLEGIVFSLVLAFVLLIEIAQATVGSLSGGLTLLNPRVLILLILLIATASTAISGFVVNGRRLTMHEARISPILAARTPLVPPPKDEPGIDWFENASLKRQKRIEWVSGLAALSLAVIFYVVVISPVPFPVAVFFGVLVATPILGIYATVFFVGSVMELRKRPKRWGFSESGIYADYPVKRPPHARPYLSWRDIDSVELTGAGITARVTVATRFGREIYWGMPSTTATALREGYERAQLQSPTARLTSSASLHAAAIALSPLTPPDDTTWTVNGFRKRQFQYAAVYAAVAIALVYPALTLDRASGSPSGLALLYVPALLAVGSLFLGRSAPRRIGVSAAGIVIDKGQTVRLISWESIHEFTPLWRGFRYETSSGVRDTVSMISSGGTAFVADALDARFKLVSPTPFDGKRGLSPPPISNSVWKRLTRATVLVVVLPTVVIAISAVSLIANPNTLVGLLGATLPALVYVLLLYIVILRRRTPVTVSISSEVLWAKYSRSQIAPDLAQGIAWQALREVRVKDGAPTGYEIPVLTNDNDRTITFVLRSGRVASLGPVSRSILDAVKSRIPGDIPDSVRDG